MTTRGARVKWAAAVLALAVWVFATSVAVGAVAMVDGQLWLYTGDGNGGARVTAGPGCGDVVIPSEVDCYPVTGIAESAFYGCTELTSVTIPNSVTWIGNFAFAHCRGLTELTIPSSVTSVGNSAFGGCDALQTLCVPLSWSGTTMVAAAGVPATCSVLYGDAWERVDGEAWSYVVSNGEAIVTAGPRRGAVSIPSVLGECPVTAIGANAFYNCDELTAVTIPSSIRRIGSSAFSGCGGLTAVHIFDLGAWCGIDYGDGWGSNPLYYAKHLYLNGEEVSGDLVIPNGVTRIGNCAFYCCSNLTSVSIPNGVTSIGNGAFYSCTDLSAVTMPKSLTTIGAEAFYNCIGLTNAIMGNSVQSIGNKAFYACTNLTSVAIPDSVTTVGDSAFYECVGLTNVIIGNGVASIGGSAFYNCYGLRNVVIGTGVTDIGYRAFAECSCLTSVTIPQSVCSSWLPSIFPDGYRNIQSLVMQDGVENIAGSAFAECSCLTSVTIPASVTNIDTQAFRECNNLNAVYISDLAAWCGIDYGDGWNSNPLYYAKHLYLNGEEVAGDLVIPDGVTSIGQYAFYYCTNLTSVTIPDSVTSIGNGAFRYCNNLTAVHIFDLAAWCGIDYGDGWNPNPLYYAKHLYLNGEEVSGDLVIPNGVTSIGQYAFYCCTKLTSVTIPDSVINIEQYAFSGCTSLTSMTIPNSVTNIGYSAFSNCHSLTNVDIGNGVTRIADDSFNYCLNLTSVTIPDSVTSIGNGAFEFCKGLTNVIIGNGVTSIGGYAFSACTNLPEVTIPNSVTNIGTNAFHMGWTYDADGYRQEELGRLATMYVPESWQEKYVYGTFWRNHAGVPSMCEIIYYTPEEPAVTATGVPHGWLEENAGEALAAAGGDYEAAARAKAANGREMWECYVAGLSTTNAAEEFTTEISFPNGSPKVSWSPDLNEGGKKSEREYVVEGKQGMLEEWGATNSESRFFRVKVGLP